MKNWFRNLGAKMQRWMYGRYGVDELYRAVSVVSLILLLLSWILDLDVLLFLALALLIWSLFRCFSKNIYKRRRERDTYLRLLGEVKGWFRFQKRKWTERKTYRYFKCPKCKANLRVPRGKGKIRITCSKCHEEIVRKS